MEPQSRHYLGVALIGMSIIVFELVLSRIFSVTMWYYFGVLAISLALLGLSASGLAVFVWPRILPQDRFDSWMARYAVLAGVAAVVSCLFHLEVTFLDLQLGQLGMLVRLTVHVLVLTVPFFFAGLCLAGALTRFSHKVPRIYFFDLLGSGLGCLVLIVALNVLSGLAIVFLVGVITIAAAILFQGRPTRLWHAALLVLFAAGMLLNDSLGLLRIQAVKSYQPGRVQEKEAHVVFERWSPISRTSVTVHHNRSGRREYHILNDAGGYTPVRKYRGHLATMAYLARQPSAFGYQLLTDGRCLIIGSGGASDVWAALVTGQKQVDAVEINPITVGLLRGMLAEFSGRPYDHPKVRVHIGEGRNFAFRADEPFDVVQLTMVDSWINSAAGAFVFNENNLYTLEAIQSYWRNLTDTGLLSITRYYHFHETLRVVSVISEALLQEGIARPQDHIIVVSDRQRPIPRMATVIAMRQAVTPEMAALIQTRAAEMSARLVYAPLVPEEALPSLEGDRQIRKLIDPQAHGTSRDEFFRAFPADVTPTSDDRPFFFYMQRGLWPTADDARTHKARALAMPIVYGLTLVLGVLSFACLILPLLWSSYRGRSSAIPRLGLLVYFAFLGMGYMLIEIPLIQKFVLFLGHPTYSFTLVLSTMLISSGLGSFLSAAIPIERSPRWFVLVLGALVLALVGFVLVLDPVLEAALGMGLWIRIGLAAALLAPIGLLMGMPFPCGIRMLERSSEGAVPWAWAINGIFSVLTTVLALLLAINLGFQIALLSGVLVYVGAFVCTLRLSAGTSPGPMAA
jgi:hypothetical protein